jgi:hypothetical protein
MRRDLILGKLAIALGGAGRDGAGSLPLADARSNEFGHRGLGAFDIGTLAHGRD